MLRGAVIDESGKYRYSLWREWDAGKPRVTFIMLNGSTADAENDDPTLRRCISFAQAWGYGALEVVNLFAYRTPSPTELKKADDPVGIGNDFYIVMAALSAQMVVCAWGTNGTFKGRDKQVLDLLKRKGIDLHCIDLTKDGIPKHPLYLKGDLWPKKFAV